VIPSDEVATEVGDDGAATIGAVTRPANLLGDFVNEIGPKQTVGFTLQSSRRKRARPRLARNDQEVQRWAPRYR
jgi:hypothetical protein